MSGDDDNRVSGGPFVEHIEFHESSKLR